MNIGERYKVKAAFEGGMGIAYVCEDLREPGQMHVLKTFKGDSADRKLRETFVTEVQAWIKLRGHQYLAQVDDVFVLDEHTYLRMPFYNRGSLRRLLQHNTRLDVPHAVTVAAQIALGMRYFSDQNKLLHLDLKPENILLGDEGQALVSDLGLARPMMGGHGIFPGGTIDLDRVKAAGIVGTIPYMAPEMLLGGNMVDARADIWAYGLLIYEMIVGTPAFNGADMQEIATAILTKPPMGWSQFVALAPKQIVSVIARCIEKDYAARFADFQQLCDALDDCILTGEGDRKLRFWERDQRVELIEDGIRYMWTVNIGNRDRKTFDAIFKDTEFMLLQQAKRLRAISKTREAIGVLDQLFGQFDQEGARMNDLWGERSNKAFDIRQEGHTTYFAMGWPILVEAYELYLVCILDLYYDQHTISDVERARQGALFDYIAKRGYPSPKLAEIHGQWLIQQGRLDDAGQVLQIAIETANAFSRVSTFVCRMILFSKRGDLKGLVGFMHESVLPEFEDLDDAKAQEACARGYLLLRRSEEALSHLTRSLELQQNNPWAAKQACFCAWNCGRANEAEKWRDFLVCLAPDSNYAADIYQAIPELKPPSLTPGA